ncbi:MAG: hypothetical protein K1060chlam4_00554 [Candidatus Anoxychlamydiales bacterium]|nr:hypothetical protein [Candidatus Anoxychlamydiales bacterium]
MGKNQKKINYLIITASGGAGNLHGAKAQKQILEKNDPNANVITKDFMLDWLGVLMGNFGVYAWNTAQKKGSVRLQKFLGNGIRILNILFWPRIFFSAYQDLLKHDIDFVFHMQALGAPAIIKAIRLYNRVKKKNVELKIIFTDLPACKSTHYFNPIKRLSKKDKKILLISSIKPPLKKDQTEEEFWNENCRISMDRVCYDPYPVRESFYKLENKKRENIDYKIKINFTNDVEGNFIEEISKKGNTHFIKNESSIEYTIKPKDFLITIILGSKPCFKAIYKYIYDLTQFMKKNLVKKNIIIFPYCSASKDPVIKKLHKMIMKIDEFPGNLTIAAMSFQKEDVIAAIYFRSDLTITKSAGQTAMELMKVSKAKFFVHTECNLKVSEATNEKLLKGIPVWESGIASFMQEKMKAQLINPKSFIDVCKEHFV